MSRTTKIVLAVVGLLVVVGVVAFFALRSAGAGPEIETATAKRADLGVTVAASGKVEAGRSVDLYPPTQGVLAEVLVSEGETVNAGDVIARLDTGPLEVQVAQARAALAQARAQAASVDDQAPTSADIAAARANVAATEKAWNAAKVARGAVDDQAPTSTQVSAARASVNAAETAYSAAKYSFDLAQASYEASPTPTNKVALEQARTAKDQAYAGLVAARAQLEQVNRTDLSAPKAQANAGIDQAYAAYKSALAQLKKLQSADTRTAASAADAAVTSAEEALALAEKTLEDATMRAPIDGVVFFNPTGQPGSDGSVPTAAEGVAVAPQAAPFTVVDMSGVTFVAEVDEADIDRVDVGAKAVVRLDAFSSDEFPTTVETVRRAATQTATGGTVFPVELPLDDTGKDILIGMKGDVEVQVEAIPSALVIPVEALFDENGTSYVYRVDGTVLRKVEIEVGTTTETDVEVVSGLEEGDVVALSGPTEYEDGMTVRVKQ